MADVFISYAHTTAKQARAAACALRAAGYSVWLDDDLAAHREFTQAIEEQLTAAKAALVIWSADAARSTWVLSEANRAREDRKLVQLAIDGTRLPMPFDQVQCADCSGWTGETEHPNWRKVTASIRELVDGEGRTSPAPLAAPPAREPARPEPLLAVLAFDNLSGDPEMAYFSDGVSEEIQQTLATGADVKVIGRTSSFRYRGPDKQVRRLAAELKATHLLDGAVRRSGGRVRISAQLIECDGETTLWSDRFDRELSDIFALQDEIAAAVAAALRVVFEPASRVGPVDPAAYELYLKALELQSGSFSDREVTLAAIGLLEQATSLAPRFGRAWAMLAFVRGRQLRVHGTDRPYAEARAKLVAAAETALALDPGLGAVHFVLGALTPVGRRAERETFVRKALAAAPNDADVLAGCAQFYFNVGRNREALDLARRGADLDPMSLSAGNMCGIFLMGAGRYQESCAIFDRLIAAWPESPGIIANAIHATASARDMERCEKLVELATARDLYHGDVREAAVWARRLQTKDPSYLAERLQSARDELAQTGNVSEATLSELCELGLNDAAFKLMERASFDYVVDPEKPWGGAPRAWQIFSLTLSASLMRDARFPNLCARLGHCDYWTQTGVWPDCAEPGVLPYDFRSACEALASVSPH